VEPLQAIERPVARLKGETDLVLTYWRWRSVLIFFPFLLNSNVSKLYIAYMSLVTDRIGLTDTL